MHLKNKLVAVLMIAPVVAMTSSSSMADAGSSADSSGSVIQKLTMLEQQGALLQQQLKNAQLEKEIISAQKRQSNKSGSNLLGSVSFQGPSVLLLTGSSGHYTATIRLPNGQITPAIVGNTLPGGCRITKINANGVFAVCDGRTESLPFTVDNGSGEGENTNNNYQNSGLPNSLPMAGSPVMYQGVSQTQGGNPLPVIGNHANPPLGLPMVSGDQ